MIHVTHIHDITHCIHTLWTLRNIITCFVIVNVLSRRIIVMNQSILQLYHVWLIILETSTSSLCLLPSSHLATGAWGAWRGLGVFLVASVFRRIQQNNFTAAYHNSRIPHSSLERRKWSLIFCRQSIRSRPQQPDGWSVVDTCSKCTTHSMRAQ